MKTVTLIPGTDPSLEEAALRAVQASGAKVTFVPAWTGAALRAPGGTPPDGLFARVVLGAFLEGVSAGDFLDTAVVHPFDDGSLPLAAELAFGFAARSAKRNLTAVGAACAVAREVARDYPAILFHERDIGDVASRVIEASEEVEVILADSAAGTALGRTVAGRMGGAAVAPAMSRGVNAAVFHAAVDDGAGPVALTLAAAHLLEFVGEGLAADRVVKAVKAAVAKGHV
jgi:hypothetical protein